MFKSSSNRHDLQFSELLAMALMLLIMLATAQLEDTHLVVLAVSHHSGLDAGAGYQGRAHLDFSAVADSQNLVDHDLLAHIRSNLFYLDFFACGNAILLAAGFYDRVHVNLLMRVKFPQTDSCGKPAIVLRHEKAAKSARPPRYCGRNAQPFGRTALPIIAGFASTHQPPTLAAQSPSTTAALALIAEDMRQVDNVIAERLHSSVPLVGQVARYIITAGGKRLRPSLLLLMAGALGYTGAQRFNLAAVVEFIHTATLLHDDVVDASTLRRGRATANENFGNPASVLVGDFLYSRAFQMMVDSGNMRVMQVLADATNVIAEGEVQQLINTHDASLDEAGYLHVIRSKTAKLFEASARLAAILAGSSAEIEQACADYGQALGTAFQVIDDVLDYDGDAQEMGKNLGDDLREGKVTLPLIVAMQRGTETQRQWLRSVIETGSTDQLAGVLAMVRETGALEATRQAAAAQAQQAIDAARKLPSNFYSQGLLQLAAQLLERRI